MIRRLVDVALATAVITGVVIGIFWVPASLASGVHPVHHVTRALMGGDDR